MISSCCSLRAEPAELDELHEDVRSSSMCITEVMCEQLQQRFPRRSKDLNRAKGFDFLGQ